MTEELAYVSHPDIHRAYPHTRCFAGAALHTMHWELVAMRNRIHVQYILAIQSIIKGNK